MQNQLRNISPIKQRILQFVESLGISKRQFYLNTGISRGTLESETGLTESILAKFIACYPEISLEWLINGEGEMRKEDGVKNQKGGSWEDVSNLVSTVQSLSTSCESLVSTNKTLVEINKDLIKQKGGDQDAQSDASCADAG